MQNILNALLNTLLVSIPEEIILVTLTLILLERFDLIGKRRWKRNIKWLSIPIFTVAITINVGVYVYAIPKLTMRIMALILLLSLIIFIVKKTDKLKTMKIFKILFFFLISIFVLIFTENLYSPIILYLTNLQISNFNSNIIDNFLLSLPSRLLQLGLIFYITYSKMYNIKFRQFIKIFKNKFNIILIFIILITIVVFWFLSINLFSNEGIFKNLSISMKILLETSITILPTMFFMTTIISNIYYVHKNIQIEQKYSNMLEEKE